MSEMDKIPFFIHLLEKRRAHSFEKDSLQRGLWNTFLDKLKRLWWSCAPPFQRKKLCASGLCADSLYWKAVLFVSSSRLLVTCNRKGLRPLLVVCFFFTACRPRAFCNICFWKKLFSINKALVIIIYCVCRLKSFSLESLCSSRILF